MIMPQRHIADLAELREHEKIEFFVVLQKVFHALQQAMSPQGFNLGMNISDVAGAGVPDHLHWHIVPRWKGDVNFMPVISGTKVISESLESVYDELQRALAMQKTSRKHPSPGFKILRRRKQ